MYVRIDQRLFFLEKFDFFTAGTDSKSDAGRKWRLGRNGDVFGFYGNGIACLAYGCDAGIGIIRCQSEVIDRTRSTAGTSTGEDFDEPVTGIEHDAFFFSISPAAQNWQSEYIPVKVDRFFEFFFKSAHFNAA